VNDNSRWLMLCLGITLVIPLQTSLLPTLLPAPWVPHLGILAVFLCGLRYGAGVGVLAGLLVGLLFDRFTASEVGLHIFALPCMGVLVALVWRFVSVKGFASELILLALFVLLGELAAGALLHLTGAIRLDRWALAGQLLPGLLADLALGAVLLWLTGRPRLGRGRHRATGTS